ncbi:MAG: radical SAM protein [Halobacteriota archaeon]
MRFRKILLIYPQYPGSHYSGGRNTVPPIGLGIIGEMLKLSGVDYEVIDLGLGYDMNYLNQRIKDYQPDAVGISMMTFRYKYMYSILEKIKESYGNIKIIAGGPHITAWKTKVLEQCPAIDFGISSEGEFTIRELCEGKELSTIKGLIYREGNNILFNGERDLIDNLDFIPFPKYEKFELDKYEHAIQINSSRGCPYKCIFCQSCSMLGKKWRGRSAANIADEIQFWYEKGYKNFSFVDDNFTLNKKRIYQLCDEMENRHLDIIRLDAPGVRVDLVDKDLLKRMREIGFWYVAFGIEAGNNKILKALKKGFTIEQAEQGVRDAVELGFAVKLYFLVGSPYETLQDIQDSINFALKYPIYDVNFGSLMPIPETELIDWVRKEGRLLTPPEVYLNEYAEFERIPHFDAPGMSLSERKYALRVTEKARIKIQRKARERQLRKGLAHLGVLGILGAKILSFEMASHLFNSRILKPLKYILRKVFLKPS